MIRCLGSDTATPRMPIKTDASDMTSMMFHGMKQLAEQQAAMLEFITGKTADRSCQLTFPGQSQQSSPNRPALPAGFGRAPLALTASPGLRRCLTVAEKARDCHVAPKAAEALRDESKNSDDASAMCVESLPAASEAPLVKPEEVVAEIKPAKGNQQFSKAAQAISGSDAIKMVLGAVDGRDTMKRPAASSASPAPKKKGKAADGEACVQCEASRSQWLFRICGGGSGSTKAILWKSHGGMEAAHAVATKYAADLNKKAKK